MKTIRAILTILLLTLCAAPAAERIKLTITITNIPVTGDSLTVNSDLRNWTNASASGTILTNLVGINESTTNMYDQFASFPYSGALIQRWSETNSLTITAPLGAALAASQVGTWAVLTLSTQSASSTFTALWPLENMTGATNRTNQASSLVSGLSVHSTNAFATNATAMSNFLTLGAAPLQTVQGPVLFSAGPFGGVLGNLTNGYWTNGIAENLTVTNLHSPGTGTDSLKLGSGSIAAGAQSVAIGVDANSSAFAGTVAVGYISTNIDIAGIAIGHESLSSNQNAIAIGLQSRAVSKHGIAIGGGAEARSNLQSIAIGRLAIAHYKNSIALGLSSETTEESQIRLGTAAERVSIPGNLSVEGSVSNLTVRGTNVINGRLDYTPGVYSGLANGNNSAVVLGTNVYVRLSGATTIGAIAGFAAEQDGSYHIVEFSGAITNLLLNESGVDATPANRITTGTGGDLAFTNSPTTIGVIYNATAARWRVLTPF